jgi:hypothetical protein
MTRKVENFEDDSMHKLWGSESELSKVEVYKWKKPGDKGDFLWIPKEQLKIDLSYQREIDSKLRVAEIAKNFDWALFGVILVALNEDGYYVLDGGHRARGAMRREDIKELPCIVFTFDDISEEARVFYDFNRQRKTVSPFDSHKAALISKDAIAIKVEDLVKKYGYTIVKNSPGMFQIKTVGAVYRMIKTDEYIAHKTFSILAKVAEGGEIQSKEMTGLFYLIAMNKAIDFFSFPMSNMIKEGLPKIRDEIKRRCLMEGKGGDKIYASAMIDIINKGQQKTKVFIP